jgi:hypothetical protein
MRFADVVGDGRPDQVFHIAAPASGGADLGGGNGRLDAGQQVKRCGGSNAFRQNLEHIRQRKPRPIRHEELSFA